MYFAGHAEDFCAERRALHDVKGLPLLRACGPSPAPYCAPSEIDARGVPNPLREGTTCVMAGGPATRAHPQLPFPDIGPSRTQVLSSTITLLFSQPPVWIPR